MSIVSDLDKIYIRAQVDGKWGSYNLAELPYDKVLEWFGSKVPLPPGHDDEAHRKAALVYILEEACGVTLVKLKGEDDE